MIVFSVIFTVLSIVSTNSLAATTDVPVKAYVNGNNMILNLPITSACKTLLIGKPSMKSLRLDNDGVQIFHQGPQLQTDYIKKVYEIFSKHRTSPYINFRFDKDENAQIPLLRGSDLDTFQAYVKSWIRLIKSMTGEELKALTSQIRCFSSNEDKKDVFHLDNGYLRLVVTLIGPGTIIKTDIGDFQATAGDGVLISGQSRRFLTGRTIVPAAIHRSPDIDRPRLVLVIDFDPDWHHGTLPEGY